MLEITEADCYEFSSLPDGKKFSYWMTSITCAIVKVDGKIEKIIVPEAFGYDWENISLQVLSEEEFAKKYTWERIP